MTSGPFSASADVALCGGKDYARLRPVATGSCAELARAIVAMPPWSTLQASADGMARYLAADNGAQRYLIEVGGKPAGAMAVRYPWLRGPYLELLALWPEFQNIGLGSALLAWFEREAVQRNAGNLWACASSFNEDALRFYTRHGFQEAAFLRDLIADGFHEVLLRKFPLGSVGLEDHKTR